MLKEKKGTTREPNEIKAELERRFKAVDRIMKNSRKLTQVELEKRFQIVDQAYASLREYLDASQPRDLDEMDFDEMDDEPSLPAKRLKKLKAVLYRGIDAINTGRLDDIGDAGLLSQAIEEAVCSDGNFSDWLWFHEAVETPLCEFLRGRG
jgi:hypothetical protein